MGLSKGVKTKIRIIEAATELVFKQGFYGITFSQIAQSADLTHPAIYNHFEDMDDILIEAALHWSAEAKVFIDAGVNPLESAKKQLYSIIERNLLYPQKNRKKDALLIGLYSYAIHSKKAMLAYDQIKKSGLLRFEALIAQGNREGSWDIKNPKAKAYGLHSFLVGEVFKLIIQPNEEKIENRIKSAVKITLALLAD